MPIGRSWRERWTLTLVACLLAACGPAPSSPSSPAAASLPVISDELRQALKHYEGEGDPSASPIHAIWAELLADAGIDVQPPSLVVPYRPGEVPATACADQLTVDQWSGNAFYCPLDQSIAYDIGFVAGLVDATGGSAAPAILAHEWGHHIQALTGSGEFDIQRELQADCFAGLIASKMDEASTSDVAASVQAAEAFYNLGNEAYSTARWFDIDEHGAPRQRMAAWSLGYLSIELGYEFCRGYDAWEPGHVARIGPFDFVEFPGRTAEADGDDYVLDDALLGPLTIEHEDISDLAATTPRDLVGEWLERWLGTSVGTIQLVDIEQADELGLAYYTADADPAAGVFRRHGAVGLQISPADAGGALIFHRPASGMPPIEGEPDEDAFRGALRAVQVVLMAALRTCAPHHTQGGELETHNAMCFPDL